MISTEEATADKVHNNLTRAISAVLTEQFKHVGDGLRDFSRYRVLSLRTLIMAILAMQGNTLDKELLDMRIPITVSGFSQQRAKLDATAFRDILTRFNAYCADIDDATYKGYRLWAIDGTAYNLPLCVLKECGDKYRISAPKSEVGYYAQTHLVLIYDLLNRVYVDMTETFDECGALYSMLYRHKFEKPTILAMDRGLGSYNSLAHLGSCSPNLFYVQRLRQDRNALRIISTLPMQELDEDITVEIVTTQRNEDKAAGRIYMSTGTKKKGKTNSPKTRIQRWDFADRADANGIYTLKFRAVRILLDSGEYETLATNLPREKFDASAIKELYRARWGIETSFRELKYSVGMIRTHSKKINSIMQEVYAALIVQNYTNRIARAVVVKHGQTKYTYMVNHKMANYISRTYLRDQMYDKGNMSGEDVMRLMSHYTVPIKPNRHNTRNLRVKGFTGYTYRIV